MIITLYTNYNYKTERLIPEDQKNLIEMLKCELGLDSSIQAKWYFSCEDPWSPGMSEDQYRLELQEMEAQEMVLHEWKAERLRLIAHRK